MKRAIAVSVGSMVLAVGAGSGFATSAAADDGSPSVVFVQASKKIYLHPDNSLTVTVNVRCVPGWFSSDVDVWLGQGTNFAEGHQVTDVACDDAWHPLRLTVTSASGAMRVGRATISSQFVVYNNDTGDPAGAHDNVRRAHIVPAHFGRG